MNTSSVQNGDHIAPRSWFLIYSPVKEPGFPGAMADSTYGAGNIHWSFQWPKVHKGDFPVSKYIEDKRSQVFHCWTS